MREDIKLEGIGLAELIMVTGGFIFAGNTLEEIDTDVIMKLMEEHYAKNKYQATDVIIDAGHGLGFCIGNIFKYAKRYGLKNGYSRSDLLKILHYTTIALYVHDREIGNVD